MTAESNTWNSELYQSGHAFVWQYGRDLLALLAPKPGERILDVGCGTGQLTAEIAQGGAHVVGLDLSADMIAAARANFSGLQFEVADIAAVTYDNEFDAIFSNAALHWVKNQDAAIANMARALRAGGRLVFEMGGRGNIRQLWSAALQAFSELGVDNVDELSPRLYPSIGEYAPMLESSGLQVTFAVLFDRPTPLEGGDQGLRNWLQMFGASAIAQISSTQREQFFNRAEELARPALYSSGQWTADYKRLRMIAIKP